MINRPSKAPIFPILVLILFCYFHTGAIAQTPSIYAGQFASMDSVKGLADTSAISHSKSFLCRAAPYGMLAAAGGLLFPLDREINRQFYKGRMRSHTADQFSLAIRQFGMSGPFLIAVPILAGHGLLYKNKKSLYVAGELAGGILVAGGVTEAVKHIFGRERPYQTSSPFQFFKGGSAFYSGHAITAWTFATIISKNYPRQNLEFIGIRKRLPILPALSYTAAALVCVQRLYSHNHWASDVYYGALAGYGAGSLAIFVADKYRAGHLRIGVAEPGIIQVCYGFN